MATPQEEKAFHDYIRSVFQLTNALSDYQNGWDSKEVMELVNGIEPYLDGWTIDELGYMAEAAMSAPGIMELSAREVLWQHAVQSTATLDSPGRWVLLNGGPVKVAWKLLCEIASAPGIGNALHWYGCRCRNCEEELYPAQIEIAEIVHDELKQAQEETIQRRSAHGKTNISPDQQRTARNLRRLIEGGQRVSPDDRVRVP